MECVEETWCHGVCGGDLVPWGVWRRPGAMGCVEETWCHGVWRRPGRPGGWTWCHGVSSTHPMAPGVDPMAPGPHGTRSPPHTPWHQVSSTHLMAPGLLHTPMGCVVSSTQPRRPGAMGCVEETWYHGVCGGDLVPWDVWRRPGVCVEETWCHGVCGGDLVPWGV